MMSIRRIGALRGCLALVIATGIAACGDGDDATSDDATTDEPPWCLDSVVLPTDETGIEAVFQAMPQEIDGKPKEVASFDSRLHVGYEEAIEGTPSMMAFDLGPLAAAMPEGGEMNGLRYMEIVMEVGGEEVDSGGVTGTIDQTSMEPSTGLVWGTGTTIEVGATPDSDVVAPSMMFAEPDGDWVFTVTASSDEMLLEVLGAFCHATR